MPGGLPINLISGHQIESHKAADLHTLKFCMLEHAVSIEPEHASSSEIYQMILTIAGPLSPDLVSILGANGQNDIENGEPVVVRYNLISEVFLVLTCERRPAKDWKRWMNSVKVGLKESIRNVFRWLCVWVHVEIGDGDWEIVTMVSGTMDRSQAQTPCFLRCRITQCD